MEDSIEQRTRWSESVGARTSMARGLITLAAVGLSLALALPARAGAQSFTWSGESESTPNWSAAANWEAGIAPLPSASIGTLEFPRLSSARCTSNPPTAACSFSVNNLSGLTAEALRIDDSADYLILGEEITLGDGGLSASPAEEPGEFAFATLFTPIALDAAQTWSVAGLGYKDIGENGLYLEGGLRGSNHALTVDLSNSGIFSLGADSEAGPVAIDGADPGEPGIFNGVVELFGAELNASDDNPVNLSHVFFYGAGGTGPLTTEGAEMDVAVVGESPKEEGTLEAASATFDPSSEVLFTIANTGTTPGKDYSRLVSPGAVDLAGAELGVLGPKGCSTLPPGQTYTLVSTTGGLSGAFGNALQGAEIPIEFFKSCGSVSQKLQIAYDRSGATQTVTGTVIAGETSSTALSVSPNAPVANQSVTLTATVTTSSGIPAGTIEFQNGGAAIPGCAAQQVRSTGSSFIATCQTVFPAGSFQLSAAFTPGFGVNLRSSQSAPVALTVSQAPTSVNQSSPPPTPPQSSNTPPPPVALQQVSASTTESGGVSLAGTAIPAQSGGVALVRLRCTTTDGCDGKLILSIEVTSRRKGARKRSRTVTLATGSFSVSGDRTTAVRIELDAAARALLGTDHGRLSARLTILELESGQGHAQRSVRTKSVRIVVQKTGGSRRK